MKMAVGLAILFLICRPSAAADAGIGKSAGGASQRRPTNPPTIQERIDSAQPNETIRVEAGIHAGPLTIRKPLTLRGEPGADIRGNGSGNVVFPSIRLWMIWAPETFFR